jgi:hypothetical protein
MEIKSISGRLFRTNVNKSENRSNQTNPFGVSFKGNIINADVFEEKKSGLTENTNRGKMLVSTLVGSINAINSSISNRLNSVVNFGRRIGETTANLWNQARGVDMGTFFAGLPEKMSVLGGTNSVSNLQKLPVADLEARFKECLATMEA